ncbi:MAG: alpha/beta fold hydrolase [Armatimonadetes bacterium]|nr:alpha/beta fold hydrolase [Armatimonadota bacterium]
MPQATVGAITLHYERTGDGPAVVLVPGLGGDHRLWHHQMLALAGRFDVIAVDNRGAGQSAKPDEPYSTAMFADDLAGLLDALEIASAHVVGASMGGFVAQEFALRHPDRLDRLVLCCTSHGGPRSVPIPQEAVDIMVNRTGDPRTDLLRSLELMTAEAYRAACPDAIEAHIAWRLEHPQPLYAYHRQLGAAAAHDAADRLRAIRAPTLVCHGTGDRVVPSANAALLADGIPHARLHLFEGSSHLFFWEQAAEFNRLVIEFLVEDGTHGGGG